MLDARNHPPSRQLWDQYQIKTAIIPPETRYIKESVSRTRLRSVPARAVGDRLLDDISTVLVRRIPEHEAIIRDNEFLLLRPHMPANHYVVSKSRVENGRAVHQRTIALCAKRTENLHCAIAHSARLRLECIGVATSARPDDGARSQRESVTFHSWLNWRQSCALPAIQNRRNRPETNHC